MGDSMIYLQVYGFDIYGLDICIYIFMWYMMYYIICNYNIYIYTYITHVYIPRTSQLFHQVCCTVSNPSYPSFAWLPLPQKPPTFSKAKITGAEPQVTNDRRLSSENHLAGGAADGRTFADDGCVVSDKKVSGLTVSVGYLTKISRYLI
jgi:hypothetical protein